MNYSLKEDLTPYWGLTDHKIPLNPKLDHQSEYYGDGFCSVAFLGRCQGTGLNYVERDPVSEGCRVEG